MTEHQTSRTLVKSAPELWAECSDAASLARHLGAFGEIRITKLEPETAVAWEGTAASGTVRLESSGWGTRVTLTVTEQAPPAEPEPVAEEPVAPEPEEPLAEEPQPEEPEPEEPEPVAAAPRPGRFARFRLFRRRPGTAEPEPADAAEPLPAPEPVAEAAPDPQPVSEPEPAPDPEPAPPLGGEDALNAALESLGMAHHRPYSRA
jgi:hypothetical protein